MKRALVVVDLQNDFLPGGALAVADGDATVPVANRLLASPRFDARVATQDFHPPDHGSFASRHPGRRPLEVGELHGLAQVLWPDHCVAGTPGASFASRLDVHRLDHVVRKGTDPTVDSYSGFFDNGRRVDTGLRQWLAERGVTRLTVLGLATDYCVQATVLDALRLGFLVEVVVEGCRAVDATPGDGDRALDAMRRAGAGVLTVADLAASP